MRDLSKLKIVDRYNSQMEKGFNRATPLTRMLTESCPYDVTKEALDGKVIFEWEEKYAENGNFKLIGLPLPLIHADVEEDETSVEMGARRIGCAVERTILGVFKSDEGTVPPISGLSHHKAALRMSFSGTIKESIRLAVEGLMERKYYGPFVVIHSPDCQIQSIYELAEEMHEWCPKMEFDKGTPIVATHDTIYLQGKQLLIVQMTPDVIRIVTALKPQVVEWQSTSAEVRVKFDPLKLKVMCIIVPLIRNDYLGRTGIAHITE